MYKYYDDVIDYYNEDSIPDRIGKGSNLTEFLEEPYKTVKIIRGLPRLEESMKDILTTPIGRRFFRPDYGSKLHKLLFEPNDEIARDMAIVYTREAIEKWEPRVQLLAVRAETDGPILTITINYKAKSTGTPGSYVYTIERQTVPMN